MSIPQPHGARDDTTGLDESATTREDTAGLELAAITRDDELVETLGRGLPVVAQTDEEFDLATLLAEWRTEVHARPADGTITVDDVEKAIAAAKHDSDRRARRHLRLVAGAAAVIGVALGSLVVLSEGANPDDPLWGVKKVVFAERAVQTQATYSAQINLEQAEKLLAAGDPQKAKEYVRRAQADLAPVSDDSAREPMDQWIDRLSASAESAIKAATPVAPPTKAERKAPKPAPKPPVTDDMPQYVPPAPRWTPPPQQNQEQAPRYTPQPKPQPEAPQRPAPRPPITILPN